MMKAMAFNCSEMGKQINGLREKIETIEFDDKNTDFQEAHDDDPSLVSTPSKMDSSN
jgi:hypothetical protein